MLVVTSGADPATSSGTALKYGSDLHASTNEGTGARPPAAPAGGSFFPSMSRLCPA